MRFSALLLGTLASLVASLPKTPGLPGNPLNASSQSPARIINLRTHQSRDFISPYLSSLTQTDFFSTYLLTPIVDDTVNPTASFCEFLPAWYPDADLVHIPKEQNLTAWYGLMERWNLLTLPERYTGYSQDGDGWKIWEMLHDITNAENSFWASPSGRSSPRVRELIGSILSGMHASISTHICHTISYNSKFAPYPDLQTCLTARLLNHQEWITQMEHNYHLILQTIAKLRPFVEDSDSKYENVNHSLDSETRSKLLSLIDVAYTANLKFRAPSSFNIPELDEAEQNEMLFLLKKIDELLNCVTCSQCRVWGTLQGDGYATALTLRLVDGEASCMTGGKLVALVNTLDRLSFSIEALEGIEDLGSGGLDREAVECTGPFCGLRSAEEVTARMEDLEA
ncbi:endoplasmic reticulum oxidoreductin 1 [Ascobolus immersus RN42]|uniref:Endoplasmic reticulum oxidoreductin 1 n=1 Tax=Ascobolus immersus RN42 TaxID=1160509 RepID=A0A3N4HXS6_ASCIM|nr:endoplasmic reticulum oxidoreductin 1 [Ascobolus immersus RN42]